MSSSPEGGAHEASTRDDPARGHGSGGVDPAGPLSVLRTTKRSLTHPNVVTERRIMWRHDQAPRRCVSGQPRQGSSSRRPGTSPHRIADIARRLLVGGVALALFVAVAVIQAGAWTALFGVLISGALAVSLSGQVVPARIVALAVGVMLAAVDYLAWRWGVTNWAQWYVALPLLLAEAFAAAHAIGMHFTIWPRNHPPLQPSDDPSRFPVFVLIPTVNEGPEILAPTVRAALAARDEYLRVHPHSYVEVVICNDGAVAGASCAAAVTSLAERLGVRCITRSTGGGAKAGNIEHARQLLGVLGDSLLVIFDADQVANPAFLRRTIPYFADPQIGWVQTGQYYRNIDNPVARWANDQQSLFYVVLCPGKARQNAAFICGTNVVIRAGALDEIGGLPTDSVTEDFAASIRLHARWRSVFVTDRLAEGLGPVDLNGYFQQQRRWARGTLGLLRTHWDDLVLPRSGGLSVQQRLQYALACTHYLCGVRDLVFILAPVIFIFTGLTGVRGATLSLFLWHFIPYLIASQLAFWHVGHRRTSVRGILIGFLSFPVLVAAAVTVVCGKRGGFMVTPKRRSAGRRWRLLAPHVLALVVLLAALLEAVRGWRAAMVLPALWVAVICMMLATGLYLSVADWRSGLAPKHLARRRHIARVKYAAVMAAAVSVTFLAPEAARVFTVPTAASPTAGSVAAYDGHVRVGVVVPAELLDTGAARFTRATGLEASIVGRSQEIRDAFNHAWTEGLAERGSRVWINLSFADDGQVRLDSSPRAVANGVHDDDLRRWAHAIARYGRPVYLTVLQHADRNWSASSGVANGGIPQDVMPAWLHIHSVFRKAGATNVIWLWAPADPAHDRAFRPPDAAVDGVVLTMFAYPRSRWADPAVRLARVAAAHPGKPIFVEVAAAGAPKRKAAWLASVAAAAGRRSDVAALVYHQGGPATQLTGHDLAVWSVTSDKPSLDAVRDTWGALVGRPDAPCRPAGCHGPANRRDGARP
jgi:cellulose synthase/poly-beta-1,6-N-acetylglucosamine synthase-like glycosyltransferase